jgi:hypothetical protein
MTKKNLDPFAIENLRLTGNEQFLKSVKKEEKTVIREAPRQVEVNEAKLVKAAPALLLALIDAVSELRVAMHNDDWDSSWTDISVLNTADAALRSVTDEDAELLAKLFSNRYG